MQSSTRAAFRAGLLWAMGLLAGAFVAGLALRSTGWGPALSSWFGTLVNGWLSILTSWVPVAVCWLAVLRVGVRRPEVMLAAAAMTAYAAGDTFCVWMQAKSGSVAFPSAADAMYLLFYPLMVAALVVAARRHVHGAAVSVWLDGAVGSLGAAAVLAVVLSPVLASAAGP